MVRMKINNVNLDNINNAIVESRYEILCEILSRLPVKSLKRFKSVCKGWRFIIEEDSYLINLHLTRTLSTALLISPVHNHPPAGCNERKMTFLSAEDKLPLSPSSADIPPLIAFQHHLCHDISVPASIHVGSMLKPIYGLACFTNTHRGSVLIYNPTTGEKTSWIQTTTGKMLQNEFHREDTDISAYDCVFGFGFDPTTKKHKVVCVHTVDRDTEDDFVGEVLTVGSNTWKRTHQVPPFTVMCDRSVYVNGYIYWNCPDGKHNRCAFIMGFDVTNEKFNRVIEIPYFILDIRHRRESKSLIELVQVDGHLALLDREDRSINLWIHKDKKQQGIMTNSNKNSNYDVNGDGSGCWIKEIIPMPYLLDRNSYLAFEAISGTDLVVLKPFRQPVKLECLHYYDRTNKVYYEKQVDIISKPSSSSDHISPDLGYDITTFTASLLHVQTSD